VRIALGSDHAGFALKQTVFEHLAAAGHEIVDCGTDSEDRVDYPPFCAAAARAVVGGEADLAFVFGGSGNGEQMAANKVPGARAALCHDEYTARLSRQHNDANVCSIGSRVTGLDVALAIVDVFTTTAFEGGRHVQRVELLAALDGSAP
jgi:ribose 5-phosphate isomerase B